jgi:hypothetical protein
MKEIVYILHTDKLVDTTFDHSIVVKSFHIPNDVHLRTEIQNIASHNPIEQQHISKTQLLDVDQRTKNRNISLKTINIVFLDCE